jgi:hypothetical protein
VGGVRLVVTKWTRRPSNIKANTTASDTAGWQRRQGVIYGWQGTVNVLWDSDTLPSAAGVLQNRIVTLVLAYGPSGQTVSGLAILDGPAEECDNQGDVIKYELAWESCGIWPDV